MKCKNCNKELRYYCRTCNIHFNNQKVANEHEHHVSAVFHNNMCNSICQIFEYCKIEVTFKCFHCNKQFCKNHGYEWSDVTDDLRQVGDVTCMHCLYQDEPDDEFYENYCRELVRETQYLNGIILVADNQLREIKEGFRK